MYKTLYVLSVYSVRKWFFFFLSFGCINKSCCEVALVHFIRVDVWSWGFIDCATEGQWTALNCSAHWLGNGGAEAVESSSKGESIWHAVSGTRTYWFGPAEDYEIQISYNLRGPERASSLFLYKFKILMCNTGIQIVIKSGQWKNWNQFTPVLWSPTVLPSPNLFLRRANQIVPEVVTEMRKHVYFD